eukprot:XP_011666456.1 PREDICTED: guanine nucleotide-binding protein G(I)/G(S)/G(O) subunit gamma-10-like [Strongylocentrotus purpuratus]
MSQVTALKKTVEQLRSEAKIERITVSQACNQLQEYCLQHEADDCLLKGIAAHANPFKEKQKCTIL